MEHKLNQTLEKLPQGVPEEEEEQQDPLTPGPCGWCGAQRPQGAPDCGPPLVDEEGQEWGFREGCRWRYGQLNLEPQEVSFSEW